MAQFASHLSLRTWIACGALACSAVSVADPYHYKNILIGERASGMGGAFVALSDDPSGIFYNPAGLAFSFESYLSLSANALSTSSLKYSNVVPGKDYSLNSSAFVPAFFGFTQNVGRKIKFGFAVIVTDSELLDQQDELSGWTSTAGAANYLTRKYFNQDSTYLFGPSFAREVGKNFAVGVSLFGQARINKAIDNQTIAFNPLPTGEYYIENTYLKNNVFSFFPKIGFQYMPYTKWSTGLTMGKVFKLGNSSNLRKITQPIAGGDPGPKTGAFNNDFLVVESDLAGRVGQVFTLSFGNAFFFTKKFLMSLDLDIYGPDASVNVKTTINYSLGAEWYVSDSLPLRLGLFSNRSNVANVSLATSNTNLYGASVGLGYVTPGSSFSVGASYSVGTGQGTIVGGGVPTTLKESRLGLFLMGSYQL